MRLSGASVAASAEMTVVVCCWMEQELATLPATSEGAMKATTFVAISEGLGVGRVTFRAISVGIGREIGDL